MTVRPHAREVPLGALQSLRVGHLGAQFVHLALALQMLGADLGSDLKLEELS